MAQHEIFQYAIIKQEKRDKDNQVVEKAEILVDPVYVMATSQEQAQMMAARAIPEGAMEDLDRVQVVVRPF